MSQVNVSELLTDPEFARRFTVRRAKPVTYANEGEATIAYGEDSVIGVVQPIARDVSSEPHGSTVRERIRVWCVDELRGADGKNIEPDVLVIDREYFKVVEVKPWSDNGYFEAVAEGFIP